MATSTQFYITSSNTGLWHVRQTGEAARTVTRLLQEDMETHHVFFRGRLHNHITHQLLTLYGTGASEAVLQAAYDENKTYQRAIGTVHEKDEIVDGGHSRQTTANSCTTDDWYLKTGAALLGSADHYVEFLRFFQHAIARDDDGWHGVLKKYLLADTPAADDLLIRLMAGFVHPLLQLQYGLEWQQPAAVAEGLAQACVHLRERLDAYFLGVEEAGRQATTEAKQPPQTQSLLALYQAVAADPQLAGAIRTDDGNKLSDGVLGRANDAMTAIAARVHVPPTAEAVAERMAEMAETAVYVATAAALAHPHKRPKFDFFLIHHVTSIPFFIALNAFDWVPVEAKARLLEWKIRIDLAQYAARACPPLDVSQTLARLRAYKPRPYANKESVDAAAATAAPRDISPAAAVAAARIFDLAEDGHAIKLVRATGLAEQIAKSYADAPWRIMREPQLWEQLYRLEADSVQAPGDTWVRTTGLEEAWKDVENIK